MRKILKLIILPPLHLIRFIIKNIIEVVVKHAIPNYDLPILPLSKSINDLITPTPFNSPTPTASSNRKLKKVLTFSIHNIDENVKKTHDYFEEDEYKDCYNHFKKYFYTSLLVEDRFDALRYALERSLSNHKKNDLYLEFGVFVGNSTNFISKILKDIPLYGFDSFEGLREDWYATASPKGRFNKYKKVPKLNKNVIPIIGWVQDTLPDFLTKNKRRGLILYT